MHTCLVQCFVHSKHSSISGYLLIFTTNRYLSMSTWWLNFNTLEKWDWLKITTILEVVATSLFCARLPWNFYYRYNIFCNYFLVKEEFNNPGPSWLEYLANRTAITNTRATVHFQKEWTGITKTIPALCPFFTIWKLMRWNCIWASKECWNLWLGGRFHSGNLLLPLFPFGPESHPSSLRSI